MVSITVAGYDLPETILSVTVPFILYWVAALYYETLNNLKAPWVDKYRLHKLEDEKHYNLVPRRKVVLTVMSQHLIQSVLGLLLLDTPDLSQRTWTGELVRFLGAVLCMDAWQFAFHRLFHEVDWLYRNVHVHHHRIYIPYAYAALYQHPFEMLIMDTLSGLVSVEATGCSPLTAMVFWSISYIKTVSDHSNLKFPLNPLHLTGCNNAAYHNVHHHPTGLKLNYSQPYFTMWDKIYGCFKDPGDGESLPERKQL